MLHTVEKFFFPENKAVNATNFYRSRAPDSILKETFFRCLTEFYFSLKYSERYRQCARKLKKNARIFSRAGLTRITRMPRYENENNEMLALWKNN